MSEKQFRIRTASIDDAEALAGMHIASWRETYSGILPAPMLTGFSLGGRAKAWRAVMATEKAEAIVRLVEAGESIIAFGSYGRQRDAALEMEGFDGEISAIYVLRQFQRSGLGYRIMHDLSDGLIMRGCQSTALWVLRENSVARSFYEKLGGVVVSEKVDERPDGALVELAYGWKDLRTLHQHTKPSASHPTPR